METKIQLYGFGQKLAPRLDRKQGRKLCYLQPAVQKKNHLRSRRLKIEEKEVHDQKRISSTEKRNLLDPFRSKTERKKTQKKKYFFFYFLCLLTFSASISDQIRIK